MNPTKTTAQRRAYRQKLLLMGQTSPPAIAHEVVMNVVGSSVADVGCGSGVTGYLLRAAWQFTRGFDDEGAQAPTRLVGIDWSDSTLKAVAGHNPYDELILAGAERLPLPDDAVDTAISMECLEHLLPVEVPSALAELARVSRRRVVVSTPAPWLAVNDAFLDQELEEAQEDEVPLGYAEFMNMMGSLHKSTVTPTQMRAAGFRSAVNRLGSPLLNSGSVIYTADPHDVDVTRLGPVTGVSWPHHPSDDGRDDWRDAYVEAIVDIRRIDVARRTPFATRASGVLRALRDLRG